MKNIVYETNNCRIVEKNGIYYPEQKTSKILGLIDIYEKIENIGGIGSGQIMGKNTDKNTDDVGGITFTHFDLAKKFLDDYSANIMQASSKTFKTPTSKM